MGRVRRYRKYRACDPASRSNRNEVSDTIHDAPPDVFEQRVLRKQRQHDTAWDDDAQRERLLQREALRSLRDSSSAAGVMKTQQQCEQQHRSIEPKKEGESQKSFKERLRQETRKTLNEELRKLSSTAQKRRSRLKERSVRRKKGTKHKSNSDAHEEVIEFFAAEDGRVRKSDRGDVGTSFPAAEHVHFGERVSRPPELKDYMKAQTEKLKMKLHRKAAQSNNEHMDISTSVLTAEHHNDHAQEAEEKQAEQDEEEEEEEEFSQTRKRRKKGDSVMYRDDMDGDADALGLGVTQQSTALHKQHKQRQQQQQQQQQQQKKKRLSTKAESNHTINNNSNSSNSASKISDSRSSEMERLRNQVQEAYRLVKEKRRLNFYCSPQQQPQQQ